MSEDETVAPPEPIVIGSAVINPTTESISMNEGDPPEQPSTSPYGAMSPELLSAFENLEIALQSRPNNGGMMFTSLVLMLGLPFLMLILSNEDEFFDIAAFCCGSFTLGIVLGLGAYSQSSAWNKRRDRAQNSVLVESGLQSTPYPKWLGFAVVPTVVVGFILDPEWGFAVGTVFGILLAAAQSVITTNARRKDGMRIQSLRLGIEAMQKDGEEEP